MVDGLNAIGLRTFEPRGAFYAFPEVTTATGLSSEAFAQGLLEEERVAVIPGSAFGPSGEGHVRACYATSYELKPGCVALAPSDPHFHECYDDVGDFPEVDLPMKTIYTRIVTAFGAGLAGIL